MILSSTSLLMTWSQKSCPLVKWVEMNNGTNIKLRTGRASTILQQITNILDMCKYIRNIVDQSTGNTELVYM